MIGGIYCEIPLGQFYDKSIAHSVRWRLNKLLGVNTSYLNPKVIDHYIYQKVDEVTRRYYTQRRSKGYEDQSHDLKNSYGYAVYDMDDYPHLKIYRNAPFTENRGEFVDEFIETYEPITQKGWMVLLCVTAPYAARVEALGNYPNGAFPGYGLKVLLPMVNGLSQRIREALGRKGVGFQYGYILNSKTYGTVGERLSLQQHNSNLGI